MARKDPSSEESGHTILVIDDSPDILQSTRQLLEEEGHHVLTASNGREGVEIVREARPHLVLVDYAMPELTGEEVVRAIREIDSHARMILVADNSGEKPPRVLMRQLSIQGYHERTEGTERLLLLVDSGLEAYVHIRSMEKQRIGLQYILDVTPDLHRLQPLDELLQGLIWQIEGLVGAENSFLATFSSEYISRAANTRRADGFVAIVDDDVPVRGGVTPAIRVGTGRYRSGIPTDSLPGPERAAVRRALSEKNVAFLDGVSVVPLRLGQRVLGVIYIDKEPRQERDRELLEVFASQAASAIQSALLYGQNALFFDLATKDPITGLFLRGYAMQQFHQHLKRSHRNNLPISVLMADLDGFQATNDRHGHVVGDEVLRATGEILRSAIRETDCVARFDGDEFMVVLPDTPPEGARMVAQRLLERAAATTVNGASGKVPINLSVGCGTLPPLSSGPNFNLLRPNMIERSATMLLDAAGDSLSSARSGEVGEPRKISWSDLLPGEAAAA